MTTSTLTVTDFVLARIADDEAAARAAAESDAWGNPYSDGTDLCYTFTAPRVLAQCAAMRKTVGLHRGFGSPDEEWAPEGYCGECEGTRPSPCATLRALASIWSDHPDWREEWA